MTPGEKGMLVTVTGLVVLIIATTVAFFTGHRDIASIIGYLGTFFWINGMLLWVAIFDSKKRWPGEPFMQRLGSMLSYRRD